MRRLPKKIKERLIRGKYREAPTIDYGVKHKASLLIMRIYTCVLMLYKGRTHPEDCLLIIVINRSYFIPNLSLH